MAEEGAAQAEARTTAARLRRSLRWDAVAVLSVAAGIGLLSVVPLRGVPGALTAGALMMTPAIAYYSLRIGFDAAVFARWSARTDIAAAMREFDEALARRLRRPPATPARPLADRSAGAFGLARRHRRWCGLQATAILAAAALSAANGI